LAREIGLMSRVFWPSNMSRSGALFCFLLGACTRDVSGAHPLASAMANTSMLTADVQRALTPEGHFSLAGPPAGSNGELTESQARTMGRAWARQFFPWVKGKLETEHGQQIDGGKLRDCPRIFYAESPYAPLEDTADAGVSRRVFGPWWIVPLCVNGLPQVSLGIAAYATEVTIQNDRIVLPRMGGGDFVWRGIPLNGPEFPISPEAAARLAAKQTGSRVASVPRLVMPHFREGGPALARWEMAIAPSVTLQNLQGQNASDASSVFVGPEAAGKFDPILLRAVKDQPNQLGIRILSATSKGAFHTVSLSRKTGGILRLEPAEARKP
jgi:hypothetical protein